MPTQAKTPGKGAFAGSNPAGWAKKKESCHYPGKNNVSGISR